MRQNRPMKQAGHARMADEIIYVVVSAVVSVNMICDMAKMSFNIY